MGSPIIIAVTFAHYFAITISYLSHNVSHETTQSESNDKSVDKI